MISVDKLNERLRGDYDAIMLILNEIGMFNIHENKSRHEIRCSREEGRNPTSVRIDIETLCYRCFSTNQYGNIYTMAMDKLNKNFPDTLRWIAKMLNLDTEELGKQKIILPFGGYFKKVKKQFEFPELEMKKYSESVLDEYRQKYSWIFNQDGIGYQTQAFFQIGYDEISNRITVPQWDVNGNLVGIMGRLNQYQESDYRWLPIIPCQRSLTIFGYHLNYHEIQKKQYCFIGESEKFVMQLRDMGVENALATCGCNISSTQSKYIKALMCNRNIICFDEGLQEEQVYEQAKKIKIKTPIFENKVGYIYDHQGDILKKGSKNAPSDMGVKVFQELVNKKIKWI